jgi:iron complex outermembrane receptor protein
MANFTFRSIALLFISFTSFTSLAQESAEKDFSPQTETTFNPNDTVKNKKGEILQEVIITSNQQKTPVNVGKAGIEPMHMPQATAVINHAVIESQQINSMTDLLKNTNGVYIMGTTGGYQEEIASRGSALGSSNTFKNGVRYFSGMSTEFSGVEKAEFLKGSAAILYGNVTAGGVLNIVTKKPRFDFGGEIGYRFGSFNSMKPTFDVYGGNKERNVAFRINGSYEKADSFRKEVESERYYVNPSMLIKFGTKTELLLEGDYLNQHTTPDFGAGIVNYEIVDLPRDRFLGVSWGYFDAIQTSATATLNHELSDKWNLSFINALRYYKTDLFTNTRPNSGSLILENGDWKRNLQRSEAKDNYFLQQLDLKGTFNTWKIGHQFLAGVDSEIEETMTTAYYSFTGTNTYNGHPYLFNGNAYYDIINIYEPYDPSVEVPVSGLPKNTLTTVPMKRFGIYVQDLISINKYVKMLAGVRYTYQDTKSSVYKYAAEGVEQPQPAPTQTYDDAFSPRFGLIIQPTENHSIFASYSNSFQVNTGTDITLKPLAPSTIDQYEVGIKNKFFKERLFLNVTAYQITNSNLAQMSLVGGNTDPNKKELAGETQTKGFEADITSNPWKGLSVMAGYSFNETKYTKSNTYVEGSELRYNPKHTANLSANYRFETGKLKGLNFGMINSYIGDRFAGRSTRVQVADDAYRLVPLEGYFLVDATLGYEAKHFAIRTKLSNIFNELNYNVHDDNSVNPIAPTNYSASLIYKF